jgi:hypothetical protein
LCARVTRNADDCTPIVQVWRLGCVIDYCASDLGIHKLRHSVHLVS